MPRPAESTIIKMGRGCFLFKVLIAKVQNNQQQQNHNTAQIDLGGASYGRKAE